MTSSSSLNPLNSSSITNSESRYSLSYQTRPNHPEEMSPKCSTHTPSESTRKYWRRHHPPEISLRTFSQPAIKPLPTGILRIPDGQAPFKSPRSFTTCMQARTTSRTNSRPLSNQSSKLTSHLSHRTNHLPQTQTKTRSNSHLPSWETLLMEERDQAW